MNKSIFIVLIFHLYFSSNCMGFLLDSDNEDSSNYLIPKYEGVFLSFNKLKELLEFQKKIKPAKKVALVAINKKPDKYFIILAFKNKLTEVRIDSMLYSIDIEPKKIIYIRRIFGNKIGDINKNDLFRSEASRFDLFDI